MLRLKIIGIGGCPQSILIPSSSLYKDLKAAVRECFKEFMSPNDDLVLMYGFPPEIFKLSDNDPVVPTIESGQTLRASDKNLSSAQCSSTHISSSQGRAALKKTVSQIRSAKSNIVNLQGMETSTRSFQVQHSSSTSSASSQGATKNVRRGTKRIRDHQVSSENDIVDHLLEALNGGTGKRSKVLRDVFRNAVHLQYNSSKAVHRLDAVYSGKYSIVESSHSRILATGDSTKIDVTFSKGSGSKGTNFVDSVDLLPENVLRELIRLPILEEQRATNSSSAQSGQSSSPGREVLKPVNLSKSSPRIFWSLVHRYGPNIHDSLRNILRGLDNECDWLDERKRELSEKARMNLEQKKEAAIAAAARRRKKHKGNASSDTTIEPQVAVVEVTSSSSSSSLSDVSDRAKRARSFLESQFDTMFVDADILPEEWVPAVVAALDGSTKVASLASMGLTTSWRDRIVEKKLVVNSATASSSVGSQSSSRSDTGQPSRLLSLDQLDNWIYSAQQRLVTAFWIAICGGGSQKLRDAFVKVGVKSPRDLKMWDGAAEALLDGLKSHMPSANGDIKTLSWPATQSASSLSSSSSSSFAAEDSLHHIFDITAVETMLELNRQFLSMYTWPEEFKIASDDAEDDEASEEGKKEDEEQGEWLTDNEFIGSRVCILCDEQDGFWEEGTVVSYLPATEEEPMALWKIRLDTDASLANKDVGKCWKKARFQDLEEHELHEARRRFT